MNFKNLLNDNHWNSEHEKILVEWCDKAMCYRWLHSKAFSLYYSLNAWYTIPVIIISTLTGTANFAQGRIPLEYQNYFVMGIGAFNILAGIITTIQQFLKVTQLAEAHRVASIGWDKFYRNVKIELAKHPTERMEFNQIIKISKEEYDRLIETSPNVPEKIILQFKNKFKNTLDFSKIVKPEICDILISTEDYKNSWSSDLNKYKLLNENIKHKLIHDENIKKIEENNIRLINDFIVLFKNLNNRVPLDDEIIDNLKDKIDMNTIKRIIQRNKSSEINNKDLEKDQEEQKENINFGIESV
jgi:hypothetical protein